MARAVRPRSFADVYSSILRISINRPHPQYGNGLQHVQAFPVAGLSAAEGARLALELNRRYLVDDIVGYGLGSFKYGNHMMRFTSFFPNTMYDVSLVQNLCFAALHRAGVVGPTLSRTSWRTTS